MALIDKDKVVMEINRRLEAISNSSNENNRELAAIRGAQQYELINLALFINNLEVKEVDLEKEVDSQMDLLCNLLCYMDELSNGDSEGVYPLPENVIEDLQRFAKYFFELGIKAKEE